MGIILDIIFIFIIFVFVVLSAKKGFVRTFLEIVGIVLALVLAVSFSTTIANYLCADIIIPNLTTTINSSLEGASNNLAENVPAIVISLTNLAGLGEDFINNAVSNGAASAATIICDNVSPFLTNLIKTICIVVLFVILTVIFRFLARRINSLFNISILGKINKLLGGLLGIVKGLVFAILFCILVSLVSATGLFGTDIINQELIDSSYICKSVLQFCSISL